MITIYDIGEEDGTHFITDLSLPSLRAGAGREMGRGEPPETRRFKTDVTSHHQKCGRTQREAHPHI